MPASNPPPLSASPAFASSNGTGCSTVVTVVFVLILFHLPGDTVAVVTVILRALDRVRERNPGVSVSPLVLTERDDARQLASTASTSVAGYPHPL